MSKSSRQPAPPERSGNLAPGLRWRRRLGWIGAYAAIGLVAAGIFPPLSLSWLAWVVLVPLLLLTVDRPNPCPWRYGYVFGLVHFTASFAWLREVFILAPLGVALVCAIFPATWLALVTVLYRNLQTPESRDLAPKAGRERPPPEPLSRKHQVLFLVAAPSLWVGLEWARSWFCTGFPWDLLGVSQWMHPFLLPLTRYTGVYGLSFVIALVNTALFLIIQVRRQAPARGRFKLYWAPMDALAVALVIPIAGFFPAPIMKLPYPSARLRIAAVQGNIPQIRQFSQKELDMAIDVYWDLTRKIVASEHPDLIIWPETAIPDSITNSMACWAKFQELAEEVKTPMLIGTLMFRSDGPHGKDDYDVYNSVVLFDADAKIVDWYDKIHIVPFGEYVPFADRWPVLDRLFGMGRSLTPGTRHTIFRVGEGARIGVNICYEDIFPAITSTFVDRGANVLVSISNDAWYKETSGSHQHLVNALFRAVEAQRPMLRSGNNSDTVLILPDGRLVDPLVDPATGSPFYRGAKVWSVPVYANPPVTFYTRYGNLFAEVCFLVGLVYASWCLYRTYRRKQRLSDLVHQDR